PPFDSTAIGLAHNQISKKLVDLPYWNGGRNHVILLYEDQSLESLLETAGGNFGFAILLSSSSIPSYRLRTRFDLAIPLIRGDCSLLSYLHNEERLYPKKYLASFKGTRYPLIGTVRTRLARLFRPASPPPSRFLISTKCTNQTNAGASFWPITNEHLRCRDDELDYESAPSFVDLYHDSEFSLTPRGYGLATYRILEAMAAGSIPVVLADGYSMPFAPEYDFSACILHLPESLVTTDPYNRLGKILDTIPTSKKQQRKQKCLALVNLFRSKEKSPQEMSFLHAVRILQIRIYGFYDL
ncbi:MAG TPA: exostosin family protein, partial [Gammaproteobacteria bacterium]|nr:exostosin family protein [Gammaproteobacteria bacterium]